MVNTSLDFILSATGAIEQVYYCNNTGRILVYDPNDIYHNYLTGILNGSGENRHGVKYPFTFTLYNKCFYSPRRIIIYGEQLYSGACQMPIQESNPSLLKAYIKIASYLTSINFSFIKKIDYSHPVYADALHTTPVTNTSDNITTRVMYLSKESLYNSLTNRDSVIDIYPESLLLFPSVFKEHVVDIVKSSDTNTVVKQDTYYMAYVPSFYPMGETDIKGRFNPTVTIETGDVLTPTRTVSLPYSFYPINPSDMFWNLDAEKLNLFVDKINVGE